LRISSSGSTGTNSASVSPILAVNLYRTNNLNKLNVFDNLFGTVFDIGRVQRHLFRTVSWSSGLSSENPSTESIDAKVLRNIVHSRCCHRVKSPHLPSTMTPTRMHLLGIFSLHFLQVALPSFATSIV
jgi:hypothetical protein